MGYLSVIFGQQASILEMVRARDFLQSSTIPKFYPLLNDYQFCQSPKYATYQSCITYWTILKRSDIMSVLPCPMFNYIWNASGSFKVTWVYSVSQKNPPPGRWLNSAGTGRNGVPPPVSGIPPPEIAVPPPKVVVPPPGNDVPSPFWWKLLKLLPPKVRF